MLASLVLHVVCLDCCGLCVCFGRIMCVALLCWLFAVLLVIVGIGLFGVFVCFGCRVVWCVCVACLLCVVFASCCVCLVLCGSFVLFV